MDISTITQMCWEIVEIIALVCVLVRMLLFLDKNFHIMI